ncbi:MAG TPA: A/G-specific adenine glycosylase [Deltaproteobacteria bacterium]|nr:A/G-specific adenine glycosylase [Deltaproteobacteria bacterium]
MATSPSRGQSGTPTGRELRNFQDAINGYYHEHARRFPWRETRDPYCILVSEFMLQQTQTERVLGRYEAFIRQFPDFFSLALAGTGDIVVAWQGLGYNRRALLLKQTAELVVARHHGRLPETPEELVRLPGIGQATAGAVMAFAFNRPVLFIETNIRRVFIHFFFQDRTDIRDKEILALAEQSLDREDPRNWYYALMDYGAMLKAAVPNPNKKSAHYTRQAAFEGSDRQARGAILRLLSRQGQMGEQEILALLDMNPGRAEKILAGLEREGFLVRYGSVVRLRQ